jgi:esterase/lipase superfamily enzyme
MTDVEIVFATNRNRIADQGGQADFRSLAAPGVQGIAFGCCTVAGVELYDSSAGRIAAVEVMNYGGIGPELAAHGLTDPARDVVVFIHGTANSFRDALLSAAFNANWMNQSPGRPVTTIAFSWPATHYNVANVRTDLGS